MVDIINDIPKLEWKEDCDNPHELWANVPNTLDGEHFIIRPYPKAYELRYRDARHNQDGWYGSAGLITIPKDAMSHDEAITVLKDAAQTFYTLFELFNRAIRNKKFHGVIEKWKV